MQLTKDQSRKRWGEIRALWCEFDPIGVVNSLSGPFDEYDAYLGPSLRLLERDATADEIAAYLATVTLNHMGLSDSLEFAMARRQFAHELREWYGIHWRDTTV
jgi:hypothetical protein